MVMSLDDQIKKLQDRQATLKAREDDLVAKRNERETEHLLGYDDSQPSISSTTR